MPAPAHRIDDSATSLDANPGLTTELSAVHTIFRRVRDLEPDPGGVRDLVSRWDTGAPPCAELPSATAIAQQRIPARYLRLYLAATPDPGSDAAQAEGYTELEGDRAYRAGYLSEAVALYSRELRADPLRPQAWAGLRLAASKLFGDSDFGVLDARAEVVAHLYAALGPETEILALLRWLTTPATTIPTAGNPGESTPNQSPEQARPHDHSAADGR
ncbi:hypothetical protein [Nocardia sp. NPDC056000]|uniref:hypothetical protein n=1 Tax=Nocardia sp. NPDC056000 TaxID=3345674 RepID=UPI0035D66012